MVRDPLFVSKVTSVRIPYVDIRNPFEKNELVVIYGKKLIIKIRISYLRI